jgi:hypothetical protein
MLVLSVSVASAKHSCYVAGERSNDLYQYTVERCSNKAGAQEKVEIIVDETWLDSSGRYWHLVVSTHTVHTKRGKITTIKTHLRSDAAVCNTTTKYTSQIVGPQNWNSTCAKKLGLKH